jgi:hypothetical protein
MKRKKKKMLASEEEGDYCDCKAIFYSGELTCLAENML